MRNHRRVVAAPSCLIIVLLLGACAQEEEPRFVAMNLAAHPDDEDGATMNYYRRARNADVYSVIFTRGEGGQNEIGPELYQGLGAIRSQETEAAARKLGTQVHFLNFYDFGYSKTAEETFAVWGGRDHVIAQLVYLIRRIKPDVLFTNHDTVTVGPQRQHGQHQAVGLAAFEAFALAAEPSYHAVQLSEDGVDLWLPQRLFLRHWRPQEGTTYDALVPVGDIDEASGQSYAANAADALAHHATQGMDQFADRLRGVNANHFTLLRSADGAPPTSDLLSGLSPQPRGAPDISYLIDAGRVASLEEGAFALEHNIVVPGQPVTLSWLSDGASRWVFSGAVDTTLALDGSGEQTATFVISEDAKPTRPAKVFQYERRTNHPPLVYAVYDENGQRLRHAGYAPLEIAPSLHLESAAPVIRLRPGRNRLPIQAKIFDPLASQLRIKALVTQESTGAEITRDELDIEVIGAAEVADTLMLRMPDDLADGAYRIDVTGAAGPSQAPARLHVRGQVFDVAAAPGLKVGIVDSYDNNLATALEELQVDYVMLDSLSLARGAFAGLHTIVVDIRSYLVRPDLREHNGALLDWVRQGGQLVVNYHKTLEWNTPSASYAPYPLRLGRFRVTREDAPVELNRPDHVLMLRPNKIGPTAWDGWVQERGLYFPSSWDASYDELFCMSDPGEERHCGSTLLASVGEGTYMYSALVWYRQLKVFHPGAYAIFANIVSLPLTDGRLSLSTP